MPEPPAESAPDESSKDASNASKSSDSAAELASAAGMVVAIGSGSGLTECIPPRRTSIHPWIDAAKPGGSRFLFCSAEAGAPDRSSLRVALIVWAGTL